MSGVLRLAWRYVAFYRLKTAILVAGVTLTAVLPLATHGLIQVYGARLMARAEATPLVLGAKGNRFDVVMKALYFVEAQVDPVSWAEVLALREEGLGLPIPLHRAFTARGFPIVGTTVDYLDFRGLKLAAGQPAVRLGQCVVGSEVAAALGLAPGASLFSDQKSLYDISETYPLKMHVRGVLAATGGPDDRAVFVDVKTAWLIAGLVHGHQDVTQAGPDDPAIMEREDNRVTAAPGIYEYNEVTPENLASFHLHGEPAAQPLTAILVVPRDQEANTRLTVRYNATREFQMLRPVEVVNELLGMVLRIKRFFDANFLMVLVATGLFLTLVVLLSLRLRAREMETLHKLGCPRATAAWLQLGELGIVLGFSVALTVGLTGLILWLAPDLTAVL